MAGKIKNRTDVSVIPDNLAGLYSNDNESNTGRYTRTPRTSKKSNSSESRIIDKNEWIDTTGEYETNADGGLKNESANISKVTLPEAPKVVQDSQTRKALKGANDEIKKNSIKSWVGISIGILAIILFIIIGVLHFK